MTNKLLTEKQEVIKDNENSCRIILTLLPDMSDKGQRIKITNTPDKKLYDSIFCENTVDC
ncbi:hypothetical protein [Companilactobacillus bobalius]|uniref:Uncharacterized protein n=2 Tax=Companilactobacillus bobalius TaxID=2801451 RepID=A0A202FFH8_9LACO|nr:hypothetical protein [Companilactobacillus bobalius]KAE9560357.1 hypothetical protein ATN92_09320 [Companilactobacillus bobalius]KRK83101.1 hypothetical protein FC78_GL001910 [Companilactobacillus bobalius DSM 19674]OVE99210.1 hypothetical protein LKACC16343_00322 [Companilactobacillus bobalius]GEO57187.1 hypothetical protein LBO01_03160 [Companilactobacillus paralimentarius]